MSMDDADSGCHNSWTFSQADSRTMQPYRVIEESATHVTYEYRTVYTWALYASLLVMAAGLAIPNELLMLLGTLAIVIYFVVKLALGNAVTAKIQAAMVSNAVKISGNKASFNNPLRIQVPK